MRAGRRGAGPAGRRAAEVNGLTITHAAAALQARPALGGDRTRAAGSDLQGHRPPDFQGKSQETVPTSKPHARGLRARRRQGPEPWSRAGLLYPQTSGRRRKHEPRGKSVRDDAGRSGVWKRNGAAGRARRSRRGRANASASAAAHSRAGPPPRRRENHAQVRPHCGELTADTWGSCAAAARGAAELSLVGGGGLDPGPHSQPPVLSVVGRGPRFCHTNGYSVYFFFGFFKPNAYFHSGDIDL